MNARRRDGSPIEDIEEAAALLAGDRSIGRTTVEGYLVSTVHLVFDHGWGSMPPQIFETMIFGDEGARFDHYCTRYSTLQEAVDGHANVVGMIGAMLDIDPAGLDLAEPFPEGPGSPGDEVRLDDGPGPGDGLPGDAGVTPAEGGRFG